MNNNMEQLDANSYKWAHLDKKNLSELHKLTEEFQNDNHVIYSYDKHKIYIFPENNNIVILQTNINMVLNENNNTGNVYMLESGLGELEPGILRINLSLVPKKCLSNMDELWEWYQEEMIDLNDCTLIWTAHVDNFAELSDSNIEYTNNTGIFFGIGEIIQKGAISLIALLKKLEDQYL